ncbi:MAG TPA: biotin transporter BioY [Clostridiales bacterium]|nr:biotin transporter BioY [Clostridiales bacterium]
MSSRTIPTRHLILCGLFATLTAVGSWISIPLPGGVPINLALLFVYLSGSLLGFAAGTMSQIVYVLLGLVGLPVFHNFTAGPGILAGPTGGYIIGYILAAAIVGFAHSSSRTSAPKSLAGFIIGLGVCYTVGTLWFMHVTNTPALAALTMCVFPFLPGDAVKIIAAFLLTKKIRPLLERTH